MNREEGPVRIVDAHGVHPEALDRSVKEQRLHSQFRLLPANPEMIFVFGSNEAGRHGAGAALFAYNHRGAVMGQSFGHHGTSFAIPTKDPSIRFTLPLSSIKDYVRHFIMYAESRRDLIFQVTAIGCGLAGLKHEQIAPMFFKAPANCLFDHVWEEFLPQRAKFWGTF